MTSVIKGTDESVYSFDTQTALTRLHYVIEHKIPANNNSAFSSF